MRSRPRFPPSGRGRGSVGPGTRVLGPRRLPRHADPVLAHEVRHRFVAVAADDDAIVRHAAASPAVLNRGRLSSDPDDCPRMRTTFARAPNSHEECLAMTLPTHSLGGKYAGADPISLVSGASQGCARRHACARGDGVGSADRPPPPPPPPPPP